MKHSIESGKRFGRWVVLGPAPSVLRGKNRRSASKVRCDCGTTSIRENGRLKKGETESCGCTKSHGHTSRRLQSSDRRQSPEYVCWFSMRTRCHRPDHKQYSDYGGRGITVCDRWRWSFKAFLADMGLRPSSAHSIDRIDNNKGYYKENCRWATRQEQSANKRSNRLFTFYGKTMPLARWSRVSCVPRATICTRLETGWRVQDAFWTPPLPHKKRQKHREMRVAKDATQ